MKQTLLSSLAFLKVNSDTNRGTFIDNFIPFTLHSIKKIENQVVSIANLQEMLFKEFSLCIPQNVVKALLHRIRKNGGYVKLKNHVFYKVSEKLDGFVFSSVQEKVERIYLALIANFIEYSKTKYDVVFSEGEAEQAILSFISYHQVFFYSKETSGKIVPEIPTLPNDKKIIVADYIYEAKQSKPDIYDYLDTVVKGYMIASALYLPDVHETKKRFHKTRFFLDTSFIIHVLGYNGEELKLPCLELLDLLYKNNAKICCFKHTFEEIEGILDACSNSLGNLSNGAFGQSIRYFVSMGYSSSDIKLLISHLRDNIQKLRIEIVPAPNYSNHAHVIDETTLFNILKTKIEYRREDAIYRDVASISAIYRLRQNNYSIYLEESPAVFVTTNRSLTEAANDFFFQANDQSLAPPCITDFILTNLLWLKTPNRAPDLPMKRIVADAYAAIQPDEKLMAKWISEIKKLEKGEPTTEEDYYFIRSSDEIFHALMEFTRGNADLITTGKVPQVLERAKELIRRDAEEKYFKEIGKREETEAALAYLQATERRKTEERENRLRNKSRLFARKVTWSLRATTILLLILGIFWTLPLNLIFPEESILNITSQFPYFIFPALLLLMLVLGVANLYYGTTLSSWLNSIEINLEDKVYKFLTSLSN